MFRGTLFAIVVISCLLFRNTNAVECCAIGYGINEDRRCELCPPGTKDEGYEHCEKCEPREYQDEAGQTRCLPCPAGTTSTAGAAMCVACPDEEAVMSDSTCGKCPPGQYYHMYISQCVDCEPGFFKAESGNTACLPCPTNAYSPQRATNCTVCNEDEALLADGSCGKCVAGQYYNLYQGRCYPRPPGTFTAFANVLPNCLQCGPSSFSSEGASECHECPIGEFYLRSTQSCGKCPAGTFYNEHELECVNCAPNTFSVGRGERFCRQCYWPTFAREGSSTCFRCEPGKVFIAKIDKCARCREKEKYSPEDAACEMWLYDEQYSPSAESDSTECEAQSNVN